MSAPYYQDDSVTIYHGDCLDVMNDLYAMFDLVLTSPPYNLGTNRGGPGGFNAKSVAALSMIGGYDSYHDAMPQPEYDAWQRLFVATAWQTLTETGALFYQHKPRVQYGEAMLPTEYGRGLPLRQVVIWDRSTGLNFSESFFLPKSEWIVIWAKPGWRLVSRVAAQLGDVWRFPPEVRDDHPAPFPIGLPLRVIGATTARDVLDPFMGSGTTLRAAKDLGRRAVGIEIDERYCEIAARRMAQGVLAL